MGDVNDEAFERAKAFTKAFTSAVKEAIEGPHRDGELVPAAKSRTVEEERADVLAHLRSHAEGYRNGSLEQHALYDPYGQVEYDGQQPAVLEIQPGRKLWLHVTASSGLRSLSRWLAFADGVYLMSTERRTIEFPYVEPTEKADQIERGQHVGEVARQVQRKRRLGQR